MKRIQLVIAVLVAIFYGPGTQIIVQAATIEMSIETTNEDGTTTRITAPCPVFEVYDGSDHTTKWGIGYSEYERGYTWKTDEGQVRLRGMLDPDPMMLFSGAVIDFGAPSSFGFIFTMPLTAQGPVVKDSFWAPLPTPQAQA